ncbi:Hexosyltransferase [Paragonimus heterotremus]|uniref:Hexosyltransferase n=1 Tax=Paragonimus heterotremus TaxID=100268 RepID=A0A8J4SYT1_9TREM|nr:Hexosyltransferase [Paragonimus heterotremus]
MKPYCFFIPLARIVRGTFCLAFCLIVLFIGLWTLRDVVFPSVVSHLPYQVGTRYDACIVDARSNPDTRCPWPPKLVFDLFNQQTGVYNLQLNPILHKDEQLPSKTHWELLQFLYNGQNISGSELKQLVDIDAKVRMDGVVQNYELYPQMMNVKEAVKAIRLGDPVQNVPINDPPLEVIRSPLHVCTNTNGKNVLDLVVLIKSCSTCSDNRVNARNTYMQQKLWNNFRVQFAFVTGMPTEARREKYDFDGVWIQPYNGHQTNQTTLEATQKLLQESDVHQDLLIGSFSDTYYNLTLKMMLTFRWTAAFCKNQALVYLFLDDDYSLVPSSVIRLIRKMPFTVRPYLNGGTAMPDLIVRHPSKSSSWAGRWSVSANELPWTRYPSYSSGAAYILGSELVIDAAIAMAFTRYYRLDDAYLGFVWNKIDSRVYTIRQMKHTINNLTDPKEVITAPRIYVNKAMDWATGIMNMFRL